MKKYEQEVLEQYWSGELRDWYHEVTSGPVQGRPFAVRNY